jgi:hypothetical protein
LKICLVKTWFTLTLSSKASWKWHFYVKPGNKKVCWDILQGIFDFFKIFC